ncbi:MAG: DNA-(Apurinic or apyrimidinic site) lyase [Candidatus Woesebacteria bacterium GW2011_GWB1_38_5]|uniref:DNA-(Apurinic or apyrimidinic site) lyase n=4 Tax=Candidatus Woeseibacteriota TaxID=1752722 RepID=A0A0G0KIU9_9BACT|nr:MAG: DNA-(Apurinic or apyrimidinic site) lyase [Candidatus Woesebacteria bacterium GW2011_GWD1_38_10]KKQ55535.1 MAG: DNA-(Apurinic or apyrimidinic site) lyase [Candidatus Woesebacteria bacterium GW2011_GWC1_38_13]KKQ75227.1 MAG: DNA-(Apurinic or apyrimidinic site) lyase [Microgenomates group bacterium GW2011_GWF1_38_5]KKQ75455.1 MAG: DNA-(Apurinic or apyrimidinic site) lyase [Candidatus Woesebacteria bacterium GW2011_GWB1_38_5]KKQ84196.1 MAG: DNA-(Apurinic or apyrimidinic site) lyase [Candid
MNIYKFEKVFSIFRKKYQLVPLEVFGNNPYKTLVSTLLSSRTKDEVTLEASTRLFKVAKDIKILRYQDIKLIEKLIYPVGFYHVKAKQLKMLSERILKEFKGKIPDNREELMKLPGVGRKTANLVLNRAFNIPAIAVDTHVHKISNLLGWVKTKTPEQTEKELIKILPKKYWPEINRLFVSIGRQYNSKRKITEFLHNKKLI